jgi:site-specific DNA-methyltransferase (adenine-specific)
MAWTNFKVPAKIYSKRSQDPERIHPTQKPIDLYAWLLKNYAKPGDRILDTHLGSGSIAIACWDMGFDLTGFEIDKYYYAAAVARLERHKSQGQLF